MQIDIKTDGKFEETLKKIQKKYGEDFEYLNGFHDSQMNFSEFISNFIKNNVNDTTIDANANASHKDIVSLLTEKGKPHDKLFAFNKIFYEMNKEYGLQDAQAWLESEYNGAFYLHDAPSSTYKPYCFKGDTIILTKEGARPLNELVGKDIYVLNKNHEWEKATVKLFGRDKLWTLVLERLGTTKTIYTTGNHKWFIKDSINDRLIETQHLAEGMEIPYNTSIDHFEDDVKNWTVLCVKETNIIEDVYCAVAEETHSFTLEGNILTHNCYAYDLTRLATEGLFFLENYNNQPPKHLTTYFDDVIEYVSFFCNRSSGAVGLPNLLIWSYYYWKKDVENGYYIKNPEYYLRQNFQKFIYRLNQPFLRVDQSSFTNISIFDTNYINALFGGVIYPDDTMVIDYVDEIIEHQKVFMEVVSEIRQDNMFTFPVLTYSLLYKDGKFIDEDFARWCSDHNTQWNDSNFFISEDVNTLSNCCRLLSQTNKLDAFINSIGGTALSIGSVKVNTINLMRIYHESGKDENVYLNILHERVKLCCKVLDRVRHIIKRNVEKGLLPNYQDGGVELAKQYCTVGILGLYEVIKAFGYTETDQFGYISYTDEGIMFAKKIFDVINDVKDSFTDAYSFNVESVPAERAAVILCAKDTALYNNDDCFIYSNQWIPLTAKCTIKEKLRLSAILDKMCSGGAIAHINIENNFPNTDMAWDMLNKIAQSGVIYFAFNTKINTCKHHHGFVGTDTCPVCGEGVYDTYQRIVGFLVPSKSYSSVRLKEFKARQWYELAEMKGE